MRNFKKYIYGKFSPIFGFLGFDPVKFRYFVNKLDLRRDINIPKNQSIINSFSKLFYDQGRRGGTWNNTYWMGVKIMKTPLDLWVYQEIIFSTKPDIIIETGTAFGGSALFLASILDLVGYGRVLTVDIYKQVTPKHKRIKYLIGSSTSGLIVDSVKKEVGNKKNVMVILDSDHRMEHVRNELEIYSKMVSVGNYLIVEDSSIGGHPVYKTFGAGPYEAVRDFLKSNKSFVVDKTREKFLMTSNPSGYLKKIS